MSKCTCGCATVSNGPSIKELRRDAFKESVALIREASIDVDFEQAMTLACFLIGLGEVFPCLANAGVLGLFRPFGKPSCTRYRNVPKLLHAT